MRRGVGVRVGEWGAGGGGACGGEMLNRARGGRGWRGKRGWVWARGGYGSGRGFGGGIGAVYGRDRTRVGGGGRAGLSVAAARRGKMRQQLHTQRAFWKSLKAAGTLFSTSRTTDIRTLLLRRRYGKARRTTGSRAATPRHERPIAGLNRQELYTHYSRRKRIKHPHKLTHRARPMHPLYSKWLHNELQTTITFHTLETDHRFPPDDLLLIFHGQVYFRSCMSL